MEDRPRLPIHAYAERSKLLEKIEQNDVTILMGRTGSGKSSQLPQMIVDKLQKKVLCAQPRRVATTCISERVAFERNAECGGEEVGYHIGQEMLADDRKTKILFCTTGILWERIRKNGQTIFDNRDYIIIDEVHERSVETDLVLASLKEILSDPKARRAGKLVLMSATANAIKYQEYFEGVQRYRPEFRVGKIMLDNSVEKISIHEIEEYYYEDSLRLANFSHDQVKRMSRDYGSPDKSLSHEVLIAATCIVAIDGSQLGDEPSDILVFLPRFRDIQEMHTLLLRNRVKQFEMIALHSSLDVEHTLDKIIKEKKGNRTTKHRIYLATNIAESSLTIPDVAYVFDLCQTNSIYWKDETKCTFSRIEPESVSQSKQRRGRTGRTCAGKVYYMIPAKHFRKLTPFEPAKLQLSSLRDEALTLICSENKFLRKPFKVLRETLDPPDSQRLEDALNYLSHIEAVKKHIPKSQIQASKEQLYTPTLYGLALSSLPFDVTNAEIVLRFACEGYLFEGLLVAAIKKSANKPVKLLLHEEDKGTFHQRLASFSDLSAFEDFEFELCSHVAAFVYWRDTYLAECRMKRCLEAVRKHHSPCQEPESEEILLNNDLQDNSSIERESKGQEERINLEKSSAVSLVENFRMMDVYDTDKAEWCEEKTLSFNSMHSTLENIYQSANALFYRIIENIVNSQLLKSSGSQNPPSSTSVKRFQEEPALATLRASFGGSSLSFPDTDSRFLRFRQVLGHVLKGGIINQVANFRQGIKYCAFYQNGVCRSGDHCQYVHDPSIRLPGAKCVYFHGLQSCKKGENCGFSHAVESTMDYSTAPIYHKCAGTSENFKNTPLTMSNMCESLKGEKLWKLEQTEFMRKMFVGSSNEPASPRSIVLVMDVLESSSRIEEAGGLWVLTTVTFIKDQFRELAIEKRPSLSCTFFTLTDDYDQDEVPLYKYCPSAATLMGHMENCSIKSVLGAHPDILANCNAFEGRNVLIWWRLLNILVTKENIFHLFAAVIAKITTPTDDSTKHDIDVLLTMDYRKFHSLNVIGVAATAFFELVDVRPSTQPSNSKTKTLTEFHFLFKLNINQADLKKISKTISENIVSDSSIET